MSEVGRGTVKSADAGLGRLGEEGTLALVKGMIILKHMSSASIKSWIRSGGGEGSAKASGLVYDVATVELANAELRSRASLLGPVTLNRALSERGNKSRRLTLALLKNSYDGGLVSCLLGGYSVEDSLTGETTFVLDEFDDAEWEDLRGELAGREVYRSWSLSTQGRSIFPEDFAPGRAWKFLDGIRGALAFEIEEGSELSLSYMRTRLVGVGADEAMARALLGDQPDVSLDELVECMRALAVGARDEWG